MEGKCLNYRCSSGGRTWRRRKARREKKELSQNHIVLDENYINLLRWAKKHGAIFPKLFPAVFSETGRGIMASRTVLPGEEIISLPEKLLLTSNSVMKSNVGIILRDSKLTLTPRQKLCVFVIYEYCLEERSFWYPYIKSLPERFDTPACFTRDELKFLPDSCKFKAWAQICEVKKAFKGAKVFWTYLLENTDMANDCLKDSLSKVFTYEIFRWAWFVINTRSVYMDHGIDPDSSEHDTYALAPVLDLLNHTSTAQVEAGFDSSSKCYQIHTLVGYHKSAQVFINYGPHDNQTLLVEYGFILADNINSKVNILKDRVLSLSKNKNSTLSKKRFAILERNNLFEGYFCTLDGLSWNLLATLRILALSETELESWERTLSGHAVSESSERLVRAWVITLLSGCLQPYLRQEKGFVCKERTEISWNVQISIMLANQEKMLLEKTLEKYQESEVY